MTIGEIGFFTIPAGLGLVFFDGIKAEHEKRKFKKAERIGLEVRKKKEGSIALLLRTSLGVRGRNAAFFFILISGLMGLGSMVLLGRSAGAMLVLISGIFFTLLPYLFLRLRLEKRRVKASNEGDVLISALLNNYKISGYNILSAIERTAFELNEAPKSKRLLFNLYRNISKASTSKDIESEIENFRYALGTFWGNILANNILLAVNDGVEITESLKDLSETVLDLRNMKEEMKKEKNETRAMLRIMFPAMLIVTIYSALGFFGMSLDKYLSYQFETPSGRLWIMLSVISYIFAHLVNSLLSKDKLDF